MTSDYKLCILARRSYFYTTLNCYSLLIPSIQLRYSKRLQGRGLLCRRLLWKRLTRQGFSMKARVKSRQGDCYNFQRKRGVATRESGETFTLKLFEDSSPIPHSLLPTPICCALKMHNSLSNLSFWWNADKGLYLMQRQFPEMFGLPSVWIEPNVATSLIGSP